MSTPTLQTVQQQFSEAILEESSLDGVLQKGIPAEKRVEIYRGNVVLSMIDALKDTFPTVYSVVGEGFFNRMMRLFTLKHPPASACLLDYGMGFPDFIADYKPADSLPYLKDSAELDWAHHQAYYQDDVKTLDPRALQSIEAEHLPSTTFKLHPTLHLIHSEFAIDKIWAESQKTEKGEADNDDQIFIDQPVWLLIYRTGRGVNMHHLCPGAFVMLQHLQASKTFQEAVCAALDEQSDFNVQEEMTRWLSGGVFSQAMLRGKHVG